METGLVLVLIRGQVPDGRREPDAQNKEGSPNVDRSADGKTVPSTK